MYIPPHFAEQRTEEIDRIIREHPLGTLSYLTSAGLDATHLPFHHRQAGADGELLVAHVSRKNPIIAQVADGSEVLVIFHGPQSYISPNWYPSKHEAHRQVPTWDYQVVHVRGRIRFIDDVKYLRASVALLTHVQEARVQEETPWKLADGEKDYIAKMLESIVGLEISISSKTGVTKMSQNKEERDKQSVAENLQRIGEHGCAAAVQSHIE